jgi:hypothetical protein
MQICDKNLEFERILSYNNIKEIPEMFDTPVILNLRDVIRESYICKWMSGRRLQRKAEAYMRTPT